MFTFSQYVVPLGFNKNLHHLVLLATRTSLKPYISINKHSHLNSPRCINSCWTSKSWMLKQPSRLIQFHQGTINQHKDIATNWQQANQKCVCKTDIHKWKEKNNEGEVQKSRLTNNEEVASLLVALNSCNALVPGHHQHCHLHCQSSLRRIHILLFQPPCVNPNIKS